MRYHRIPTRIAVIVKITLLILLDIAPKALFV